MPSQRVSPALLSGKANAAQNVAPFDPHHFCVPSMNGLTELGTGLSKATPSAVTFKYPQHGQIVHPGTKIKASTTPIQSCLLIVDLLGNLAAVLTSCQGQNLVY